MLKVKRNVPIAVVVATLIVATLLQIFWYPGVTVKQTTNILLSDQKFGVRAFDKAVWHGEKIFDETYIFTKQYTDVNFYQAEVITRLISAIAFKKASSRGKDLFSDKNLYPKLFGALILSRSSEKTNYKDLLFFLISIAERNYAGLEKDYFKVRDYYSEIAIISLGYFGGEKAFHVIKNIINENSVPYSRHDSAITALVKLNDKRAIRILQDRIIDKNFKATLPAVEALLELGDSDALIFAKKRLALNLGGDDIFLREMVK